MLQHVLHAVILVTVSVCSMNADVVLDEPGSAVYMAACSGSEEKSLFLF